MCKSLAQLSHPLHCTLKSYNLYPHQSSSPPIRTLLISGSQLTTTVTTRRRQFPLACHRLSISATSIDAWAWTKSTDRIPTNANANDHAASTASCLQWHTRRSSYYSSGHFQRSLRTANGHIHTIIFRTMPRSFDWLSRISRTLKRFPLKHCKLPSYISYTF